MQKADPDEVVRLWVEDGLNVIEIAGKVGVTHQRVSRILRERNIDRGPKRFRRVPPSIDPDLLRRLYVEERQPLYKIAKQMKVSFDTVTRWLDEHGIPRRRMGEASILYPEIRELKIGESMEVPRGDTKNRKAWTRYYGMAKAAGIRVSLKTIGEKTMRLTRVA